MYIFLNNFIIDENFYIKGPDPLSATYNFNFSQLAICPLILFTMFLIKRDFAFFVD